LLSVTDNKTFKAFFLDGHREQGARDTDAVWGYSKFADLLRFLNVQTELLRLGDAPVPEDCNVLVIAGPQQALNDAEQERIGHYLNQGGRLFLLYSPQIQGGIGLERLLATWQVRVGNDLVAEKANLTRASERPYEVCNLVITNYPTPAHPITRPLLRSQLDLQFSRSVDKQPNLKTDADSPKVEVLAASSADGIAITDVRQGAVYPDPRDRRGAIPVMVAVEKGNIQGVSADKATRMVVAGSSLFLANGLIDSLENRDFAVLAVNWLLDRPRLMGGIAPRPVKEYQVKITLAQMTALRWILLAGIPGSVMFIGILVWLRRRT
jgi:hypothetical protein